MKRRIVQMAAILWLSVSAIAFLVGCGGDGSSSSSSENPRLAYDEYGYPLLPLEESPVKALGARTVESDGFCQVRIDLVNEGPIPYTVDAVAEVFDAGGIWTGAGPGHVLSLAPGEFVTVGTLVVDMQTPERRYPSTCAEAVSARPSYLAVTGDGFDARYVDYEVYEKIGDPWEKIGNHGLGGGGSYDYGSPAPEHAYE